MNREWMRERLESFKALCEGYDLESRRAGYADYTDGHRAITDEMSSQMPTVREILKRLDPALAEHVELPTLTGASGSLRAVQQGLGILRDRDEWAANLAPDAPSLIADQFHPYVWAAASPLWDTGQYRVAVGQASVSLSAHIAKKAASPLRNAARMRAAGVKQRTRPRLFIFIRSRPSGGRLCCLSAERCGFRPRRSNSNSPVLH